MTSKESCKTSDVWFTGDTHFGHSNIIKYCGRPFKSVEEMDQTLIDNWNSVVKPGDLVYHVGDFSFHRDPKDVEELLENLNGEILLVRGSHDKVFYRYVILDAPYIRELHIGPTIILCHYAMRVWPKSHYGSWHLYGHSHATLPEILSPDNGRIPRGAFSFDVGVDAWNFTPVSFAQVEARMYKKGWYPGFSYVKAAMV